MKQLTRDTLVDMLYNLWTSGLVTYGKFLELKGIKDSRKLQLEIDNIIDRNK